jgi:hypothetical protein
MHLSKAINFRLDCLRDAQPGAAAALHQIICAFLKWFALTGFIRRLLHGVSFVSGSSQSTCGTSYSSKWRKMMLMLPPSMGVGIVGSLVTAIVLAADWYVWDFRYRISQQNVSQGDRSPGDKNVIYVPNASGREVVVNVVDRFPDRNIPPVQARLVRSVVKI